MADHSPATSLLADQRAARKFVSERFTINNRDIIDAHHLAFSALASAISSRVGVEVSATSPAIEGQMALIAQFAIGVEHCESAIAEGLYAQAAALMKQQLETIAAVEEYRRGNRKEKVTPNIGKSLSRGLGELYGKLNEISHPSRHNIAKNIVLQQAGGKSGANIVVQYNGDLARELYGQHVYLIQMVVRMVDILFSNVYGAGISWQEKQWCGDSQMVLVKSGLIRVDPAAQGKDADWVRSISPQPL